MTQAIDAAATALPMPGGRATLAAPGQGRLMGRIMRCLTHAAVFAALAVLLPLASAGCQAVTRHPDPSLVPNTVQWRWPLRFTRHSFSAYCYDTYECSVFYAAHHQVDDESNVLTPSSSTYGPDYRRNWLGSHAGLYNFPLPAQVRWRSRDGSAHEASIDIGAIFADELVVHRVRREDIPLEATIQAPSIILEVNDRTINVYMRATIPTKQEQVPGNRYSRHRSEVILVKSFHY